GVVAVRADDRVVLPDEGAGRSTEPAAEPAARLLSRPLLRLCASRGEKRSDKPDERALRARHPSSPVHATPEPTMAEGKAEDQPRRCDLTRSFLWSQRELWMGARARRRAASGPSRRSRRRTARCGWRLRRRLRGG